jgi:hypothetical protein
MCFGGDSSTSQSAQRDANTQGVAPRSIGFDNLPYAPAPSPTPAIDNRETLPEVTPITDPVVPPEIPAPDPMPINDPAPDPAKVSAGQWVAPRRGSLVPQQTRLRNQNVGPFGSVPSVKSTGSLPGMNRTNVVY